MAIKAGIGNKARDIPRIYCSPGGSTKRVKKVYASRDGKAVQVWIKRGTEKQPYLIRTLDDWALMNHEPGAYYRLENDITVNRPVVIGLAGNPFTGVLDGNGHKVRFNYGTGGITAAGSTQGLFGVNRGTIQNLNVWVRGNIWGYPNQFTAGIAAVNQGTISRCRVLAETLQCEDGATVGLVAADNRNVIEDCDAAFCSTNNTVIKGRVGTIAAVNSGHISRCMARHTWQKKYYMPSLKSMGALVYSNSGTLESCYRSSQPPEEIASVNPDRVDIDFLWAENAGAATECGWPKQGNLAKSYMGFDFDRVWLLSGWNVRLRAFG